MPLSRLPGSCGANQDGDGNQWHGCIYFGMVQQGQGAKAQIDLVLDRADHIVNLCEIKFSTRPYTIDKQYAETLQNRQWIFEQETKTRKSCQQVMLTTYGLAKISIAASYREN